jgi:hypothetical protein
MGTKDIDVDDGVANNFRSVHGFQYVTPLLAMRRITDLRPGGSDADSP